MGNVPPITLPLVPLPTRGRQLRLFVVTLRRDAAICGSRMNHVFDGRSSLEQTATCARENVNTCRTFPLTELHFQFSSTCGEGWGSESQKITTNPGQFLPAGEYSATPYRARMAFGGCAHTAAVTPSVRTVNDVKVGLRRTRQDVRTGLIYLHGVPDRIIIGVGQSQPNTCGGIA